MFKIYLILILIINQLSSKENNETMIKYYLKMPKPSTHYFHVEMEISNIFSDSILVKMPYGLQVLI